MELVFFLILLFVLGGLGNPSGGSGTIPHRYRSYMRRGMFGRR